MDAARERLQSRFVLERDHRFGDQVGGVRADNVHSEHLAVASLGDHLHEAGRVSENVRLAVRGEREAAHPDLVTGSGSRFLRQSHRTHLRHAVGGRRHSVPTKRPRFPAGDGRHRHVRLGGRHVSELGAADDIADRKNPGRPGLADAVHGNEAASFEFDPDGLEPDVRRPRRPAHRYQQPVVLAGPGFFPDLVEDLYTRFGHLGSLHPAFGPHPDLALAERLAHHVGDLGVLEGQDPGQHLEEFHLRAEATEHGRKLGAHRAGADDAKPSGKLVKGEHFRIGQDPVAVHRQKRERPGLGTGGDDDVSGLQLHPLGLSRGPNLDPARAGEPPEPVEALDAGPLQEQRNTSGEFGDHPAAAALQSVPVEAWFGDLDSDLLRRPDFVEQRCGVEENLAGYTADVKTRPAEARVLLHDRRPQSGGLGLERGHVTPGAAPDDHDVEGFAGILIHCFLPVEKPECYAPELCPGGNMAG